MRASGSLLIAYDQLGLHVKKVRVEIEVIERALASCQPEHQAYYKMLLARHETEAAGGELELRRLHREIEELQSKGL